MALGFFKKLLGNNETAAAPATPAGAMLAATASVTSRVAPHPEGGCITLRDELVDEASRIIGYHFSVQALDDGQPPSPHQKVRALERDRLLDFTLRRKAIVSLDEKDWFAADFAQFSSPNTRFYLPTPNGHEQPDWQRAVSAIKDSGAAIVVDGKGLAAAPCPPDLLLFDFQAQPVQDFEHLIWGAKEKFPATPILVDGVQNWAEQRLCRALDIQWCSGGFLDTADEAASENGLDQSRLVIVEMLNLLRREGTASELAAIAKRDPAVAIKILEMANSPLSGLSAQVASIDKAMMVLGREALYRWLLLSMFRSKAGSSRDESLLELALFRGRLLERLSAGQLARAETEELFLVGLLSLVDSLLNLPMSAVVKRMHLPASVTEVLLDSSGPYGRWLMLALAVEKGRERQITDLAKSLQLSPEQLETTILDARLWAEEALGGGSA